MNSGSQSSKKMADMMNRLKQWNSDVTSTKDKKSSPPLVCQNVSLTLNKATVPPSKKYQDVSTYEITPVNKVKISLDQ